MKDDVFPTDAARRGPASRDGGPTAATAGASSVRPELTAENIAELRAYLRRGLQKALARRPVNDHDIDDFTQDAIIRILKDQAGFRQESRFSTWAMAVAIRVAFGALRRRRHREQSIGLDAELAEVSGVDAARVDDAAQRAARHDLVAVLRRAIAEELTDRQRTAVLGELKAVPTEMLADRLGITRNAFYKLHHDARRKLKRAILAAGFSEEDVNDEWGAG